MRNSLVISFAEGSITEEEFLILYEEYQSEVSVSVGDVDYPKSLWLCCLDLSSESICNIRVNK